MPGIHVHDEVKAWLLGLDGRSFARASRAIDLLETEAEALRMPHSRALGGSLFELRFTLARTACRITYWFSTSGRIVLLTVFRKQRDNERHEVDRARRAMDDCKNRHDHWFERDDGEG